MAHGLIEVRTRERLAARVSIASRKAVSGIASAFTSDSPEPITHIPQRFRADSGFLMVLKIAADVLHRIQLRRMGRQILGPLSCLQRMPDGPAPLCCGTPIASPKRSGSCRECVAGEVAETQPLAGLDGLF